MTDTPALPAGPDLADELARYTPPSVALALSPVGSGSRGEIIKYVEAVLRSRTSVNDDTTVERLARGLVTSILHRLGAGYSVAAGIAAAALVPASLDTQEADPS